MKRLQALAKSDIIDNYPDSRYAEILLNPESALLNNENSPETLYNNLYAQFELGEYQQVIEGCDLQIIRLGWRSNCTQARTFKSNFQSSDYLALKLIKKVSTL